MDRLGGALVQVVAMLVTAAVSLAPLVAAGMLEVLPGCWFNTASSGLCVGAEGWGLGLVPVRAEFNLIPGLLPFVYLLLLNFLV